jgi:SEC-C motif-containing protein
MGRAHRLHEISRFVREDGKWYYVDGAIVDSEAAT